MQTLVLKRSFIFAAALFVATLLMQLALVMPAHAATGVAIWDGGGSTNNFSEAANWKSDNVPAGQMIIYLDTTGMTDGTFNVDLSTLDTNESVFESITLSGTGSGTFTLTGDKVHLIGSYPKILEGGLLNNGDVYNYQKFNVEVDLVLDADMNFRAGSNLTIGKADGSNTLDLGTFTMTKTGEKPLTINAITSGSGGVTVSNGWFVADKDNTFTGALVVANGGTLKGNGTVGDVTVQSGGEVAPGLSPGCLTTGDLTFVSGSVFTVEIEGGTVCDDYDQTIVTGAVDLGGATLVIARLASYEPADGTEFIIIDNDGTADGVTGTFAGLAEGESTTVDGVEYTISYEGGDGNDVVLSATMVAVPAEPDTGFGPMAVNFLFIAMATALAAGGMVIAGRKLQDVKAQK